MRSPPFTGRAPGPLSKSLCCPLAAWWRLHQSAPGRNRREDRIWPEAAVRECLLSRRCWGQSGRQLGNERLDVDWLLRRAVACAQAQQHRQRHCAIDAESRLLFVELAIAGRIEPHHRIGHVPVENRIARMDELALK